MSAAGDEVLTAEHVLEYPYSRSVGPAIGAFLAGLRDGRLVGCRASGGRVVVPPTEYDPETAETTGELVEVGPEGTVTTWAWVSDPAPQHPLDHPFAWVLVQPDGADTAILHVLDAGSPEAVSTGMRVRPEFRPHDERVGSIADLRAFVPAAPADGRVGGTTATPVRTSADVGAVTAVDTPIRLDYHFTAGTAATPYLRGLAEGRFVGQRCPVCQKVYIPPRGSCPTDGVATEGAEVLAGTGTVTTYCVVNVPFAGQSIEIPYICAQVLLDGADISFMALIQEIPAAEVRMGLRVEAVWVPPEERGPTMASVKYFRPSGEPDADYESYRAYL